MLRQAAVSLFMPFLRECVTESACYSGPGVSFAEEAKWLAKTDQLLAEGTYEGHSFIVFHGVSGKFKIQDTSFFLTLYPFMQKGDLKSCEAAVMKKIDLIVREARVYV